MTKKNNILFWVQNDLDGVCSVLIGKWFLEGRDVTTRTTMSYKFRDDLLNWLLTDDFKNYSMVFIVGVNVSKVGDIIDHDNVIIADHHKQKDAITFKHARVDFTQTTSSCKLLYKMFSNIKCEKVTILSTAQKLMILYCDDYTCYKLEYPETRLLNALYRSIQRPLPTFLDQFHNGFTGFTQQNQNILKQHFEDVKREIASAKFFICDKCVFQKQKYTIVSAIANRHTNDISDYVLKTYNPDIVIVVNTETKKVSFRRNINCSVDLNLIAEDLCDGGGHEYSAGGVLTEHFLEYTKNFTSL